MVEARRVRNALVMSLVVFLLAGTTAGFAQAATDAPGGSSLAVPMPRPGDVGVYKSREVIVDDELAGQAGIAFTSLIFEWLPEEWIVDENFDRRLAHPLALQAVWRGGTDGEVVYHRKVHYDAWTGEPLMEAAAGRYAMEGQVGVALEFTDELVRDIEVPFDVYLEEYGGQLGPCAMRTSVHGRVYDSEEVIRLHGHCDLSDENGGLPSMRGRAEAWEEVNGHQAMRFQALEDPRVEVWYASDAPFPVKVRSRMSDLFYYDWIWGRMYEMTLVEFRPGAGEYPRVGGPAVEPGPGPLDLVAATDVTVDDAGTGHPFPLSRAYQVALADSGLFDGGTGGLSSFMRRPEAHIVEAWGWDDHDDQGRVLHNWVLMASDGRERLGKHIVDEPAGPGLLPGMEPRVQWVFEWQPDHIPQDVQGHYPPRSAAPNLVPAIAPLWVRFDDMEASPAHVGPANTYGFVLHCLNESCNRVEASVQAGHYSGNGASMAATAPRDLGEDVWFVRSSLAVDASGRPQSHMLVDGRNGRSNFLGFLLDEDGQGAAAAATGATPAWVAPAAPAAAGLGLLALLAGAVYYFWPTLKALPAFTLFSRIRHDRLLQHPKRAQIMQVVEAEPGIHFQELGRRTGVGRGALDHHLRKLADARLLVAEVGPGYTCYFPRGRTDRRAMAAAPLLKSKGARDVLDQLVRRGEGTVQSLAKATGLSPSTVSHHLGRLREAGVVAGGGRGGYRPTDAAVLAL